MTRRVGFNDAQTDWRRADRETAPDGKDHAAPISAGYRVRSRITFQTNLFAVSE